MAIYLDYNASCPIKPGVIKKVCQGMEVTANASSQHAFGRTARQLVEKSRDIIAEHLAVPASSVVFTGSGTEANNLALLQTQLVQRHGGEKDRLPFLLIGATEHPSLSACATANTLVAGNLADNRAENLKVDANGLIDLSSLEQTLIRLHNQQRRAGLVSVQMVNSETGVRQPIAELADLVHSYGWLLHSDAVQAFGKFPFLFEETGADMLTISAHKTGGPQGVAALIVRPGFHLAPLIKGGGQERNRRSGTENVAAISGFGEAVSSLGQDFQRETDYRRWRDAFEARIMEEFPEAIFFGKNARRISNTTCVSMPGLSSSTQLMHFDLQGFAVSAGYACSSGKTDVSENLLAMGYSQKQASCAIRVSMGWKTLESDMLAFARTWLSLARKHAQAAGLG